MLVQKLSLNDKARIAEAAMGLLVVAVLAVMASSFFLLTDAQKMLSTSSALSAEELRPIIVSVERIAFWTWVLMTGGCVGFAISGFLAMRWRRLMRITGSPSA